LRFKYKMHLCVLFQIGLRTLYACRFQILHTTANQSTKNQLLARDQLWVAVRFLLRNNDASGSLYLWTLHLRNIFTSVSMNTENTLLSSIGNFVYLVIKRRWSLKFVPVRLGQLKYYEYITVVKVVM